MCVCVCVCVCANVFRCLYCLTDSQKKLFLTERNVMQYVETMDSLPDPWVSSGGLTATIACTFRRTVTHCPYKITCTIVHV